MSSTHPSNSLERLVERTKRIAGGIAASVSSATGGRLRPTAAGGLLVVLASIALSVAAALALGETVRIRWSVGTYYGPEFAPTALVLAAFPVLTVLTYLGLRALRIGLERAADGEFEHVRGIYELCVLATLTTLVLSQVAFVAANLLWG